MKKSVIFALGCLLYADDLNLKISSFGSLGALYNQGVGAPHSYANVMAHVGVKFDLENGWDFGIGAIGSWNVFSANRGKAGYDGTIDGGDVSDAFAHYKNSRLEFALGRFNTNFIDFDYISGNIQGASGQVTLDNMTYWGIFMDSMLLTGAHKNIYYGLQGINIIGSYYPTSKKKILGSWGEVFALGLQHKGENITASAFTLLDTQLPMNYLPNRDGVLFQIGGDIAYHGKIGEEWFFETKLRGIFQLGNTSWLNGDLLTPKDSLAGLLWLDQQFKYRIFEFGAGIYGVMGTHKNGGIYTFSDPSRFYGQVINQPLSFPAPYFREQILSAYLFGSIDLQKAKHLPIKIDGIVAFGGYNEYSLIASYNVLKMQNMQFDFGVGYVYSRVKATEGMSSLLFFGKFYY